MFEIFVATALALAAKATAELPPVPAELVAGAVQVEEPGTGPARRQLVGNEFNPQISLVMDTRFSLLDRKGEPHHDEGHYDNQGRRFRLKELELGFAANVDPFLRAEAYLSFHDEGGESKVEVEEAFAQYTGLGAGLSAKAGILAGAVGRVNRNHLDQLNFLDYPFVIEDLFGEHGLRAPGASVSYLLPGNRFNELTFEVLDTPQEGGFFSDERQSFVYVGRYRTFFDFGGDSSVQLGGSFLNGSTGDTRGNIFGVDLTYKLSPAAQTGGLVFESEAYWADSRMEDARTSFGMFAALNYQIQPRVWIYGKYDYSEMPGTNEYRRGWAFGTTFRVTEFHHWRAEFQTIRSNHESTQNLLTVQFQWLIGSHPAHRY
jgi:hypothetical protein